MRKLVLQKLHLLSKKSKRARALNFEAGVNVIRGDNDTGKSSVLKSIYHAFGATPQVKPTNWAETSTTCAVDFELGDKTYRVLRQGNMFALFSGKNDLIQSFDGVGRSGGIGETLATMFDFGIRMKDKNGKIRNLPPSYFFLPYYIDQDIGWSQLWASFEGLQQFSAYRQNLISYHTGIRPNQYFELKISIEELRDKIKETTDELEVVIRAQKKFKGADGSGFNIDQKAFQRDVDRLLVACEKLKGKEEAFRHELNKLENRRILTQQQIEIAHRAKDEIQRDSGFASESMHDGGVECPTCGSEFENDFVHRFSLLEDADACQDVALRLREVERKLQAEIAVVRSQFSGNEKEVADIRGLLSDKKGKLKFADVIESESQKKIQNVFREELEKCEWVLARLSEKKKVLIAQQRDLSDSERIQAIKGAYSVVFQKYLHELDVHTVKPDQCKDPGTVPKTAGSDLPRAMLAQAYGLLETMAKYSPSYIACPLIVDSPLQQDLDDENIQRVLEFALKHRIRDSQLLLGTVKMHGVQFKGNEIHLTEPMGLLQKKDYAAVNDELSPLLDAAFEA